MRGLPLPTDHGAIRMEPLDCWLPLSSDDGRRITMALVRSGLEDQLRRHGAAAEGFRIELLRWAITAVDPGRGLRIEGVLLITDVAT